MHTCVGVGEMEQDNETREKRVKKGGLMREVWSHGGISFISTEMSIVCWFKTPTPCVCVSLLKTLACRRHNSVPLPGLETKLSHVLRRYEWHRCSDTLGETLTPTSISPS